MERAAWVMEALCADGRFLAASARVMAVVSGVTAETAADGLGAESSPIAMGRDMAKIARSVAAWTMRRMDSVITLEGGLVSAPAGDYDMGNTTLCIVKQFHLGRRFAGLGFAWRICRGILSGGGSGSFGVSRNRWKTRGNAKRIGVGFCGRNSSSASKKILHHCCVISVGRSGFGLPRKQGLQWGWA